MIGCDLGGVGARNNGGEEGVDLEGGEGNKNPPLIYEVVVGVAIRTLMVSKNAPSCTWCP